MTFDNNRQRWLGQLMLTLYLNIHHVACMAQQWLVCVPLEIHLEPNNKELMLLVTI